MLSCYALVDTNLSLPRQTQEQVYSFIFLSMVCCHSSLYYVYQVSCRKLTSELTPAFRLRTPEQSPVLHTWKTFVVLYLYILHNFYFIYQLKRLCHFRDR